MQKITARAFYRNRKTRVRIIPKPVEMDPTGMPIPIDTELRQAIYNKTTIQHNQKTGNLPNASRFVQMVFDIEEAFDSSKMDSWTDTEMKRRKVYNAIAQVLDEKYSDLQIEAQAVLEVIIEHETPTPESTPEPTPEETPEPAPETDDPVLAEYAVLKELGEDKLNTNTGLIDDYTFLVDRGYGEEQSGILFRVRKVDSNDTKSDWNVTVLDRSDVNDQKAIVGVIVERKGGIRPNQQVVKTPKDAVLKMMQQREQRAADRAKPTPEPTEKPSEETIKQGVLTELENNKGKTDKEKWDITLLKMMQQREQRAADRAKPTPEPTEKPSEETIKQGVLTALENNKVRMVVGKNTVSVNGQDVQISVMTSSTSSLDVVEGGRLGLTKPVWETEILFHPVTASGQPYEFRYTLKVPDAVMDKYNQKFETEVLGAIKDIDNWERIGRKNAYKYTRGGIIAISKKDGRYEATISNLAGTDVQFKYGLKGETLEARLADVLSKLTPYDFKRRNLVSITRDALRVDAGQEIEPFVAPEETPVAPPGETPITEQEGEINFVQAEFYPILHTGEPKAVKGYLAENTGIDFAQLIVHRHLGKADKGEETPDVWTVSDYETGASLPSNVVSGKSRKEAIDQAIPYLKEVGAAQFKTFVDKIKRTQVDWYKKVAALRTPEGITNEQIETYLDQLGIIGYSGDTFRKLPASQITSITQQLYSNMIEKSGDNTLTTEQTEAINALQALANESDTPNPVSGGAPIVRPLETIVDVPDLSPDTSTSTKVGLLEKLISKLPLPQELQAKVDGVLPDILRKRKQARYLYLSGYKKLGTTES